MNHGLRAALGGKVILIGPNLFHMLAPGGVNDRGKTLLRSAKIGLAG
jgi:hypothetical protein